MLSIKDAFMQKMMCVRAKCPSPESHAIPNPALRVLMNNFFIKRLMLPLPVFFIIVNLLLLLVLQVMLLGQWKVRTVSPLFGTPPYPCQFKL